MTLMRHADVAAEDMRHAMLPAILPPRANFATLFGQSTITRMRLRKHTPPCRYARYDVVSSPSNT